MTATVGADRSVRVADAMDENAYGEIVALARIGSPRLGWESIPLLRRGPPRIGPVDVPDTVTEEWIDRPISGLTDKALIEVVATLRARGGRQAELVDRILQLRGKPVPSGGEEARASLSATVTDDTIVDTEPPVEGPVVEAARPSRQAQGWGGDLAIGARFAAHVIEGVAGRGGMGVVYRARQERPSRIVALKVISPELADDSGFRERFTRESELAASIEHSNVIPVYEVGEESHRLFIVMRYVEGTDLASADRG